MARIYSKAFLVAARSLISLEPLDGALWRCLVDNRISNRLPTRRGCRAGRRKLGLTEHDLASPNLLSHLPPLNNVPCSSIEVEVSTQQNLHIGTLNIQNDTFAFRFRIMAYMEDSCRNLFSNIIENDNHRLRELLPSANHPKHNLRRNRRFEIPRWRTNRFKNTFMMASTIKYNNNS